MRKMLGIFTIAVAAFFLIAVSASATPKSHHHAKVAHHVANGDEGGNQGGQCGEQDDHQSNSEGDNGGQCQCDRGDHFGQVQGDHGGDQGDCHGGDQGGQCAEQGNHQSNSEGDNGGQCQCNRGDHFGQVQGDHGGDQGDCHGGDGTPPGDGGGGGDPTPPPVGIQPTIDPPSHTFLCYSIFEVDPAAYTFDWAWHWLTSASDHYFTPYAVKGNVPYGTNVGGYHLVCNTGLLAHKTGTPRTYTDSDGQVFDQTWADAMASDHGSYNGMTLNVFPVVG